MLRTILVGIDGSAESEAARELAIRWAANAKSMAIGLGVVDEVRLLEEEAVSPPGGHHWHPGGGVPRAVSVRRRIREALGEFERRCDDVGVRHHVHDDVGTPSAQILAWSRRSDLVLLGRRTRDRNGAGGNDEGTLAAVLHQCPRPVVAVPAGPTAGDVTLIAYDGSIQASRAIYAFVASGLGLAGAVHVIAVDPSSDGASDLAGEAVEYLKSHDIAAHACPVATGLAPAEVILDRSGQLHAGLIVMGAYGQSVLREYFLGSVTRTMLREADVPIFYDH